MNRALQPEDRISHYRITGPLGAGGMGEVYAALDENLERSVALKILPPRLVRSEERVRRFIAEAKSASSLNHPNIVTIYEIGEDAVKPGSPASSDGEPELSSIHFISMELVAGETLTRKIHDEEEDLRALVGYLAQAAEGVARAHASGIVHRDLKPGNIMVSNDGIVKVLDFGLAKLTEKQLEPGERMTSAPTEGPLTREGAVLGTVGYMSPEQVMAKAADHRSDIFSMGCILYEAATRRMPFVADTDVEVMHRILRDRPAPVESLNPAVPAELRRLIRRCLMKQPDERFQSMKDLAIELRELAERWDSLPAEGNSTIATLGSGMMAAPPPPAARRRRAALVVAAAAVVGVAGIALALRSRPPADAARQAKLTILMSRNDLDGGVLSGDSRYLAYVTTAGDLSSLNVRQVRTGSDVPILPPQEFPVRGISFSPDGDYLYFLNRDPNLPNYQALFQVPSLGGAPRKVLFDVDTAVTFSPDGRQVCFRRGLIDRHADSLVIADLQSGKERELIQIKEPESFASPATAGAPAWSADGRLIAAAVFSAAGGARTRIVTIDADSGRRTDFGSQPWLFVNSLRWLPDGSGLMLSGFVTGTRSFQIYRLSFPAGEVRRITNDLDGYEEMSLSSDGKYVAAVRGVAVSNIWTVPVGAAGDARPITFASGSAGSVEFIEPLADGGVAFTNSVGDHVFLSRIEPDGSGRRQLTSQGIYVLDVKFAESVGIVFTQVSEDATFHIWRVNPDGTGVAQLTQGPGEQLVALSPDGTTVLFTKAGGTAAWSMSLPGGESRIVAPNTTAEGVLFSPDSRRLLYTHFEGAVGRFYPRRVVIPAGGGEPVATFLLPPGASNLLWVPGGEAVTYIDRAAGFNLMRRPVAKDAAEQLTHFKEGRVRGYAWSPDGRKVLLQRRVGQQDSLWVLESGGGREPAMLTGFKTGQIFKHAWARDSKGVVFTYGQTSQDVVLMSELD